MPLIQSLSRERRRTLRNGGARVAYVEAPGRGRCRCQVINSGEGGALIDWGCGEIPLGPHVKVVLVRHREQVAQTSRHRAVVLRRSGNQLGLKFLRGQSG